MKVRIGHMTFRVRPMEPGEDQDVDAHGIFRPSTGTILVSPNQCPERQAEVLLHEVLHGCWFVSGMAPKVDEETAVTILARSLSQVIRDNPALLGALVAGLEGAPILPATPVAD